jgi:phosphonate transport system substrate-binding protein
MRKALKALLVMMAIIAVGAVVTGCSSTGASKDDKMFTMVWLPNESGDDVKGARDEIGKVIELATGKKVEHKLTTDYVIAVETIASGTAHFGFLGPYAYTEANERNKKVFPLVVNSGSSGTLDDAVYYSWLAVKKGNEGQYKSGASYSIDNIAGKKFSFVSTSSASGFAVPSAGIAAYFSKKDNWKNLTQEDLLEGGSGKFFSEVLYGGSHQGSAVNLLTNKADVAAFNDVSVGKYVEIGTGTANTPGAVYKVSDGAAEPFNKLPGAEFVLISVTPVLNSPIAVNTQIVSEEDRKAILAAFTSEETTKNEKIFVPKDAAIKGLWKQGQRFLAVDDAWFNPLRELSINK